MVRPNMSLLERLGILGPRAPWRFGQSVGRVISAGQGLRYFPYTGNDFGSFGPGRALTDGRTPDFQEFMRRVRNDEFMRRQVDLGRDHAREQGTGPGGAVHYVNDATSHTYTFLSNWQQLDPEQFDKLRALLNSEGGADMVMRYLASCFAGGAGELGQVDASAWSQFLLDNAGNFETTPDSLIAQFNSAETARRVSERAPFEGPVRLGGTAVIEMNGTRHIPGADHDTVTSTALTSRLHALDGIAQWWLHFDHATRSISFGATGVGAHPLSIVDGFNNPFAGAVFSVMFRTFLDMLPTFSTFAEDHPGLTADLAGRKELQTKIRQQDPWLWATRVWVGIADAITWIPALARDILGPTVTGSAQFPVTTGPDGGKPDLPGVVTNPFVDPDPKDDTAVSQAMKYEDPTEVEAGRTLPEGMTPAEMSSPIIEAAREGRPDPFDVDPGADDRDPGGEPGEHGGEPGEHGREPIDPHREEHQRGRVDRDRP